MIHATLSMLSPLAAYRPFLDPLPVWQASRWPLLLLPLCAAVATVYKSIRCKSMSQVPREAGGLMLVIVLAMVAAATVLGVLVRGLER